MTAKRTIFFLTSFSLMACIFLLISCGQSEEEIQAEKIKAKQKIALKASSNLTDALMYLDKRDFQAATNKVNEIINECPDCPEAGSAKELLKTIADRSQINDVDPKTYEIVKTNHQAKCKNYHILLKFKDHSLKKINAFVNGFISQFSGDGKICTITMYTSKSIADLMTKYPLSKSEYKKLAKYTIAGWDFSSNEVSLNPYKDAFSQ